MKIFEYLDTNLLNEMIENEYVNVQTHSEYGYKIYNYSKTCQTDRVWNHVTELCRGLIVDSNNNIISRPFPKFFNLEEIQDTNKIPNEDPYRIFEKKDGTLGIMYWTPDGHPRIATRGSFTGEQATWASDFLINSIIDIDDEGELREKLTECEWTGDEWKLEKVKYTLLFEIVYPENRIVVNYGNEKSLTLLAVIENDTGKELEPELFKDYFTVIKSYDGVKDWRKIREEFANLGDTEEGFVVKFRNNFRLKMKFEQYFKKHFVLSGLSKKNIYEFLVNNDLKNLCYSLNALDEEDQLYYKKIALEIYNRFREIEFNAYMEYKDFETDKEAAEYFKTCKYPSILFKIRRNKEYESVIWKLIKNEIKEERRCLTEE